MSQHQRPGSTLEHSTNIKKWFCPHIFLTLCKVLETLPGPLSLARTNPSGMRWCQELPEGEGETTITHGTGFEPWQTTLRRPYATQFNQTAYLQQTGRTEQLVLNEPHMTATVSIQSTSSFCNCCVTIHFFVLPSSTRRSEEDAQKRQVRTWTECNRILLTDDMKGRTRVQK
jgi:hypothetical protein